MEDLSLSVLIKRVLVTKKKGVSSVNMREDTWHIQGWTVQTKDDFVLGQPDCRPQKNCADQGYNGKEIALELVRI